MSDGGNGARLLRLSVVTHGPKFLARWLHQRRLSPKPNARQFPFHHQGTSVLSQTLILRRQNAGTRKQEEKQRCLDEHSFYRLRS
jgi:hypothetical protein